MKNSRVLMQLWSKYRHTSGLINPQIQLTLSVLYRVQPRILGWVTRHHVDEIDPLKRFHDTCRLESLYLVLDGRSETHH